MTRTVYAISSGEYDTYQVHAVAADKATADAIADKLNDGTPWGETFCVEELPMVDSVDVVSRDDRLIHSTLVVVAENDETPPTPLAARA